MVFFSISKFPFFFLKLLKTILNMANSSKQQRLIDCMFQKVDKEQRLVAITQELKVLSKEVEKHNQEKE